jgi:CubicO group peptidase (beta-lactamase class C family)
MVSRWTTRSPRLFSGAEQIANFREMSSIYPVRVVRRSSRPAPFERGSPFALPQTFAYGDRTLDTTELLARTETTGLLVVKDGRTVFEEYWLGNDATTQSVSWSVCKSFVSALIGIAIGEGAIGSVADPVTRYAPELAGSAYDGVRLKDVLQMSSGARWNEDYSDPQSDISRFGRLLVDGTSFDEFAASCVREKPPGTYNRYNSTDTHVLGMVVRRATGRSLAEYLREKLWEPLGMEADGFWIVDTRGAEFAGGGLNAILRDYAKLGLLYMNGGICRGVQVVPEAWVHESTTPDAPHVTPGVRESSQNPAGYGYQWWVPDLSGAYCAIGIYGQFVYVDPKARVVIAKTSAYRDYGRSPRPEHSLGVEQVTLFRAIAASV